jgi:hypothetical protein
MVGCSPRKKKAAPAVEDLQRRGRYSGYLPVSIISGHVISQTLNHDAQRPSGMGEIRRIHTMVFAIFTIAIAVAIGLTGLNHPIATMIPLIHDIDFTRFGI